ncbi:polymer-forming cytoskeletal protein [Brevibacillus sp. SYP-B805]|uniref:polymer-forming cytoskeletal protein n=1 Tax=Brevibacillus sp. SYP-B805 TaxID=1578199 RepID=UPI0013EC4D9B|nr:polymer-forming cytoskeletal protein [Brevibacillus sp. SYP-B805]NGQ95081.1 polymer-forming cytoskeletal protein [Brevibacillus sp. SYP-B805]
MRRTCWLLALLLVFSLMTGGAAYAFGTIKQDTYILPRDQVIHGDLAVNAGKAVIEGTVEGDLYVFSENIQVLGEVKGDVLSFSAQTDISGIVDGNVRAFTHHLDITGKVSRNVTVVTDHLVIDKDSVVNGSILALAKTVDLFGKVGKEANGFIDQMRITGHVGQGISTLACKQLTIDSTAVIGGDIVYSSPHKAVIAPGATITGQERYAPKDLEKKTHFFFPLIALFTSVVSTLVLWLLLRYLFPAAVKRVHRQWEGRLAASIGIGALALFVLPLVCVILLLTVVGIPLALALLASLFLLAFVSKIFVGTWVGVWLTQRFGWRLHPLLSELIGIAAVLLVTGIPILGFLLTVVVWMMFLGAVMGIIRHTSQAFCH